MIVLDLIRNIAILITLTVLHQFVLRRWETGAVKYQLLSGIMFGGVGIVGMMTPVHYAPGIFFDGRSIILSISGLFGGPVTASAAAAVCGAYRLWLGGAGALVGTSVIIEAAAVGVIFYYLRRRHAGLTNSLSLWGFGLLVHVFMLLLMFALPGGAGIEVLHRIALPVLLIYPPATILICLMFIDNEKRIDTEKVLADSERKYHTIADFTYDWEEWTAPDGRKIYVSPSCERISGYGAEEFREAPELFMNIIHPDNKKLFYNHFDDSLKEYEGRCELSFRIIRRDNREVWIEHVCQAVFGPTGEYLGRRSSNRDITDRKKAEEELQKSEIEYRRLFENSIMGISEALPDGRLVRVNKAYANMYGYGSPEEMIKEVSDIGRELYADPGEREEVLRILSEKGYMEPREFLVVRRDGFRFHVLVAAQEIRDICGGLVCYQATHVDITKRKRAETALAESEDRYRSLFENSIDGILLTEPDGKILAANPAACSIFGLAEEEICRLGRAGVVDHSDVRLGPALEERASRGRFRGELRFVRADGSVFPCEISSVIFTGRDWKMKTSMIVRDISERKRTEEELKEKNRELQSAHEQLKIKQAQIIQQEKMASIGQLSAGVAHEINNPTSFVYGNLDLLKKFVSSLMDTIREQDDLLKTLASEETLQELQAKRKMRKLDFIIQDIQRLIQQSLEGAERIKNIVKNLSRFSRAEQQEHYLEDINAGLESTISIIWNEIRFNVELRKELGDIPKTMCDIAQLSQVFLNLLGNAAHAAAKGGVITVRTWADDANIYVSVADTGVGIAEENMGRIFDAFFTTKEIGKGTGLGLSISYEIVKKHNGDITVESKVGEGSTFTVRIPIVKS